LITETLLLYFFNENLVAKPFSVVLSHTENIHRYSHTPQTQNGMKKIGILHGKESSFPEAFVARINAKKVKGIHAEPTLVEELEQGNPTPYAVMIDRISQDVPFYRAYLKNAALNGTAVLNNPFWWSADEKFFNNCLSTKIGVPVPRTILLPSKQMPPDTSAQSFRNMKYPLDWEKMIDYLGGFPLFMKPHAGGGWKNVYKVENFDEFFRDYNETNTLVMLLQEAIDFDAYFRCYCLGGKYVRIMDYEPRNPHHLRYVADHKVSKALRDQMHDLVLRINHALGYDFNTVEFAIRDGIPYAIDFCNPAPDAELTSVGEENFEWVVENAANMAIEKALAHKEGGNNLTWGSFVQDSVNGRMPAAPAGDAPKKASGKASTAKK
jgi:glutathione synthase/RimK-type ligase-like ATP-grasp enzyme